MSLKRILTSFSIVACALLALCFSGTLLSQTNSTPPAASKDISGMWELRDTSGSGSFSGIYEHLEKASLTPEAIGKEQAEQAKRNAGQVVSYGSRYCHYLGMPFIMGQSPPIDIVQSGDETMIFSEQSSAARHIYTDGRGHPDPNTLESTTNGHSIGHWEGDTFVVDTIGFNELGATNIPGGGFRTPKSRLVEHFRLIDGGAKLHAEFTWTDPTVFTQPHSYELNYFRMKPGSYVMEDFCDASDAAQGRSVVPPVQK